MALSPSLTWRRPSTPPPPSLPTSTTQSAITRFFSVDSAARPAIREGRNVVVTLFDTTGMALEPWIGRGYTCVGYQHSDKPREHKTRTYNGGTVTVCDLSKLDTLTAICSKHLNTVAFACALPPSKDLSVAGARHWKRKRDKNPDFQDAAVRLVSWINVIFEQWDCPFYISNPATSQLGKMWRPPNHTYQPHDFGGYLAPSDTHPLYPEYIPAQDAYTQHQGLWTGGSFRMPLPKPVTPQWKYFVSRRKGVGKAPVGMRRMSPVLYSNWNARGARSCTPRGFARALCERLHAS